LTIKKLEDKLIIKESTFLIVGLLIIKWLVEPKYESATKKE